MTKELTESEQRLLAREVATDLFQPPPTTLSDREIRNAFRAGWDAAMNHNNDQSVSNSSSESD